MDEAHDYSYEISECRRRSIKNEKYDKYVEIENIIGYLHKDMR